MADHVPQLGRLIEDGESVFRDAIHVAVVPLVAAGPIPPGHHFCLDDKGRAYAPPADERSDKTVGIVDPFLRFWVTEGQRFWGLLYPGTVQGLRHAWVHPAFTPRLPIKETDDAYRAG